MTYPPTDQLHRRFRFLRVPQYSLSFDSDSIGTPVMFTDEARVANLRRHIERRQRRVATT